MTITLLSPQDDGVTAQRSVTQCTWPTLRNACSKHPFNTLQQVLWQILKQRIKIKEENQGFLVFSAWQSCRRFFFSQIMLAFSCCVFLGSKGF